MARMLLGLWLIVLLACGISVSAQGVSPGQVLPPSAVVTPMHIQFQQRNRSEAAALVMMLKHLGWEGTYDDVVYALSPRNSDMSVRTDEMAAYAQTFGYESIIRTGGTLDLLKALVASNFPVLIQTAYVDGPDWTVHNRVIMGYDENALYAYDPILGWGEDGEGHAFTDAELDAAWREVNRTYMIVIPSGGELLLQTVLREQWDATTNFESTLAQAQAEISANDEDAFAWFNAGAALQMLGRSEEAAEAFDRAQELGLPPRIHWLRHEPLAAYVDAGRYHEALELGQEIVTQQAGIEEVYYYMGQAYAGLGQNEDAATQYREALSRNPNYAAAESALAEIG